MPNNLLVLKHKALSDELRLRIIKLLSEKDHSLQELTEQLSIGKTTIHHHLKLLRAAKLVEMNKGKYSLKANIIKQIGRASCRERRNSSQRRVAAEKRTVQTDRRRSG